MLMSILSTNWIFAVSRNTTGTGMMHNIPLKFEDCSCALSSKCVSSSRGMLSGCYPLESILQSTLTCLSDQTCIDPTKTFKALSSSSSIPSRFPLNTTIGSIVNELMVEELLSNMSYEAYYKQCAPLSCTYSYIDNTNVIDGITVLISLYGGLVIIYWILAIIIVKLYLHETTAERTNSSVSTTGDNSSTSLTTQSTQFLIQSNYTSVLTTSNPMTCRQVSCLATYFYYEAIKSNVSVAGNYTIISSSSIDTYGFLFNNSFDPLNPIRNLLLYDDDSGGNQQFELTYFLQPLVNYVVVTSTYIQYQTGTFSLIATGPGVINFTRIITPNSTIIIQSNYTSGLTIYSPTTCHPDNCSNSNFYYEAIKINVSVAGTYTIACSSSIDTYGFLFNTTFDPTHPTENLLLYDDDGAGNQQFKLVYFLQPSINYTVIATTYAPFISGSFSLIVTGPGVVYFTRISSSNSTIIIQSNYRSVLTTYSPTTCHPDNCSNSNFYYEAIKINVFVAGTYIIACSSSIDTYGFLFNTTFDPTNPTKNLLSYDDDGAGNQQFKLVYFLQPSINYTVIATTYYPFISGNFSLIATGPGVVYFTRISSSNMTAVSGNLSFYGVQLNFDTQALSNDWSLCYNDTYNVILNDSVLISILGICNKQKLMLGCRPVGSSLLSVAAMGLRDDVLYSCGMSTSCTHVANGVGWYFAYEYSWGFVNNNDVVYRSACDTASTNPIYRLCWDTISAHGGYRCGNITALSSSTTYQRVIYHSN
ncbi:unnamed protein product [Adineta steineri]|nr:unnamed protein product [Adineta steineri]